MADRKPHAMVFPFPYQGHLTPMINLSIKLASKGFIITFVLTEFVHHSISKAADGDDDFDFFAEARRSDGLDLRCTTISDGFPVEFDRDLNYDLFWETMFRDFPSRVDDMVSRTIGSAADDDHFFLIADTFFSWPATIAKKHKLVSVSLWTEPAIVFSINYHMDLLKHNCTGDGDDATINYIPGVQSISRRHLMTYLRFPDMIPMLLEVVSKGFDQVKEADFILVNTVEELEFETLSAQSRKHPTYAIGPINFYTNANTNTVPRSFLPESDCADWLNTKPPGSVLYVSFGSIAQTSKQETAELAYGLLLSRVYFVWILRPDQVMEENGGDTILPAGFEDAIRDQGLILPWCNQSRLLSDPAIGGFLTHCGWNSIVESIWYGVPMICHPFLVDQPTNRKLVVDDWKIGINICEREQVVKREEVANKVNILMCGERSDEMKREMKKVTRKFHDSLGLGGSSERNFDQFVEDLKAKMKFEHLEK